MGNTSCLAGPNIKGQRNELEFSPSKNPGHFYRNILKIQALIRGFLARRKYKRLRKDFSMNFNRVHEMKKISENFKKSRFINLPPFSFNVEDNDPKAKQREFKKFVGDKSKNELYIGEWYKYLTNII